MKAFDRFKEYEGTHPKALGLNRGAKTAVVSFTAGAWQWVVFQNGAAVKGRRSWEMDAFRACEEAAECFDATPAE